MTNTQQATAPVDRDDNIVWPTMNLDRTTALQSEATGNAPTGKFNDQIAMFLLQGIPGFYSDRETKFENWLNRISAILSMYNWGTQEKFEEIASKLMSRLLDLFQGLVNVRNPNYDAIIETFKRQLDPATTHYYLRESFECKQQEKEPVAEYAYRVKQLHKLVFPREQGFLKTNRVKDHFVPITS